jgi:SPP1 family predicted phage head-tail adaptor
MEARKRDKQIILQSKTVSNNSIGVPVETWHTLATVWGGVANISGREYWAARQIVAEAQRVINISYRRNVKAEMRALIGTRVFDILYVDDPAEKHEELNLLCREVVTT